jgi:hypothetical protein
MSFTVNGIQVNPPPGSIAPYLGNADPSGWLICNGATKWDGSDGKYNNLINMGIGSGVLNYYYTPPDYRGAFLRGAGTSNINGTYAGPGVKGPQDMASLTHTHTASAHNHKTVSSNTQCWAVPYAYDNNVSTNGTDWSDGQYNLISGALDLSTTVTSSAVTSIGNTSVTTAPWSNVDTSPYCCGVNWIIKL